MVLCNDQVTSPQGVLLRKRVESTQRKAVVVPEDLKIPRFLKVSCRPEDNDLDMVRTKLRKNQVFHMEFNPSLENNEGQRYFADVYVPNQPEEVQAKDSSSKNRKGFLDFIIKERGFSNIIQKGE